MPTNLNPQVSWSVGTCGISDPAWVGNFYPLGTRTSKWFEYYVTRFGSIELNTTFHRMPTTKSIQRWARITPQHFRFSLKCLSDITHGGAYRLLKPGTIDLAKQFFDVIQELGPKLSVVLLQFLPKFTEEYRSKLFQFLDRISCPTRLVVELRHDSWWKPQIAAELRDRGISWAAADLASHPYVAQIPLKGQLKTFGLRPIISTTDFLYARWIGEHRQFPVHVEEYFDSTLRLAWWHERLKRVSEQYPNIRHIYAFFDNDFSGHAPTAALRFAKLVGLPTFWNT